MEQSELRKIHNVELEILDVVDSFCKKNRIRYSLYCGTMLGAVRHGGFIPWDDDIDICMLRHDYDKFIQLWNDSNNQDYVLQNKETDPHFTQSFTKIRKNHTTFLQEREDSGKYHNGIFIDILPLDRIPNNKFERILYKWNLMNYLLFTREFIPIQSNRFISSISKLILFLFRGKIRERKRKEYLHKISRYNSNRSLNLVSANSLDGLNHEMPSSLPIHYMKIKFENRIYISYSDYDGLLSAWYGNYMELPPEEQRVWRHKPILISYEKNFDEL